MNLQVPLVLMVPLAQIFKKKKKKKWCLRPVIPNFETGDNLALGTEITGI